MDDGLKNKAYLEGSRLKAAGYDNEVILARLDKQGVPEELAKQVIKNLAIEQKKEVIGQQSTFYNIALLRIGMGVGLAIVFAIAVPGLIILPIGSIAIGVVSAIAAKSKMK
jgi:hypothetical protein